MENQFGSSIKQLRLDNKLLQRQIAAILEIDTPMLSKIERGERKAKRDQVIAFAKIFKVDSEKLLTLWLADQVVEMVKGDENALNAMILAEEQIKYTKVKK